MGIMEAIKKGFAVASKNLVLVALLFVFNAIWALGSIPLINPAQVTAPITAAALGFSVLFIIVSIFVQGGALGLIRDYMKTGSSKLNAFASYGFKYYLRLFVLGLVIVLIVGLAALVATILIASTAPLKQAAVTVIATVIAVIIGMAALYSVILLLMAPYSLVCDEAGVASSIKNSINFVNKTFWKMVLLLVLLILISFGVGFIIGFIVGLITIAMPPKVGQMVIGLANSAFNGYLGVAMIAAFMAFYLGFAKKETQAPSSPTI